MSDEVPRMRAWVMPFLPVTLGLVVADVGVAVWVLTSGTAPAEVTWLAPAVTLAWLGWCQLHRRSS